jgi:hypothetical protein
MARNEKVETAVQLALARVDAFIGGAPLSSLPSAYARKACDAQIGKPASVRLGSLFFACYAVTDPVWDCDVIPTGMRGKFGDKLLSEELTQRSVTLHDAITAFGENLGWKGNVVNVRLSSHRQFADFCAMLANSDAEERELVLDYLAAKFAESRRELKPLPPVADNVLTFARAKNLFTSLLSISSEGHIQQFVIAAMLTIHRKRYAMEVHTHHPHAADKYDETAGDIEEFHEGRLIRAYEVTVRPDWKNRLSTFRLKMDQHGLAKYIIIAGGVNADEQLVEPARLLTFLRPTGRDIAVVDIHDVSMVMAAELTASELREVVNLAFDFLCQRELCGRAEFQEAYRAVVDDWLDQSS